MLVGRRGIQVGAAGAARREEGAGEVLAVRVLRVRRLELRGGRLVLGDGLLELLDVSVPTTPSASRPSIRWR